LRQWLVREFVRLVSKESSGEGAQYLSASDMNSYHVTSKTTKSEYILVEPRTDRTNELEKEMPGKYNYPIG
jgi:hypothetical protein